MPIYEYICPSCNLRFELMRSLSQSDAEALCPSCRSAAQRTVSRFTSFSKGSDGSISRIASSAPSCSGCSLTSCDTCR